MKKTIWAIAGILAVSAASAELTKHKDWDKSPEAYFLTPAEKTQWATVSTDEQAEAFISEYWARRDPTPGTNANEFKDQTGRLIAAADEQFKLRRYKRGAESVRGRLLVIFGPPTRQVRQDAAGGAQGDIPDVDTRPGFGSGTGSSAQVLTWIWDKDRVQRWGLDGLQARVLVDTSRGSDELQTAAPVEKAIAEIAEKSIRNPAGTAAAATAAAAPAGATAPMAGSASAGSGSAPAAPPAASAPPMASAPPAASSKPAPAAAAAPAPAAGAGAPAVAMSAVAALPAAVKSTLDASLAAAPSTSRMMWGGTFRAISGEPFYALQLYVPAEASAALTAPKFGGVVRNAAGDEVATFWEDASLVEMKTGATAEKAFEKSIVLPPGEYRGAFGLFPSEAAAPVASGSASFKLEASPVGLEVSPLILGNTLTPLTKRPLPTDPFVFGIEKPIRVDPKANGVFSQKDGLWYFYTVRNPSMPAGAAAAPATAPPADPAAAGASPAPEVAAAPQPRIQQRISVLRDGKPAFAPLSGTAELQPLGTGIWGSGSEIPLETFPPGYYAFTLTVRDLNAPKDSADFKGIERVGEFVVLTPEGTLPAKAAPPAAKPTPKKG